MYKHNISDTYWYCTGYTQDAYRCMHIHEYTYIISAQFYLACIFACMQNECACMQYVCACMCICACIFAAKNTRSVDTYTYSNMCTYMQHTVIIGKSYAHHMHNIWTYTYPCMHFTHGLRCKGGLNVSACIWLYQLLQRCCSAVAALLHQCCTVVATLLHRCEWHTKMLPPHLSSMRKITFKLLFPKKSSAAPKIYLEMMIGWDLGRGGGVGMDGAVLHLE